MKFMQKDRPFFWAYLCPLLHAVEPYTVRFAVVAMLDHFMIPEYIPQMLPLLESVVPLTEFRELVDQSALAQVFENGNLIISIMNRRL